MSRNIDNIGKQTSVIVLDDVPLYGRASQNDDPCEHCRYCREHLQSCHGCLSRIKQRSCHPLMCEDLFCHDFLLSLSRARRAGGLSRTRTAAVLSADTPDHPLGNTRDVSTLLSDSINQLRRGQLDPRVANAIGYLASVLLRALEQGPLEERLAHLESILGKSGEESEVFNFHAPKEVAFEQPATASKEN